MFEGIVTEAAERGQKVVRIRVATGIQDLAPGEAVRIDSETLRVLEARSDGDAAFLVPAGSPLRRAAVGAKVRVVRL